MQDALFHTGRLLVHEWGHFRWGLFNEYPDEQADQQFYSEFFYSSIREEYQATRCSAEWDAVNIVFDSAQGTYRECVGNSSVGYEDGCISIPTPYQNRTTGSIMYGYTNIEQITEFCDNDTTDESNLHVAGAPNKHNRICDLKSSWEVMREHPDFANNANPPQNLSDKDLLPNIVVARVRPLRLVLVLDTSGSMGDYNRIEKQAAATMNFIMTTAVDGISLGIVDFDSTGKQISGLVKLDSEDTRRKLAQKIPQEAQGGTCIGCGLEVALEILQGGGQTAEGGIVILITDGKDSGSNGEKTTAMKLKYSELRVKINSVAFSNDADTVVPDLASATGGRFFLQTDDIGSTGLHDAFHATVEGQGLFQERPFQLFTESISATEVVNETYDVLIDSSIGHRTTIEVIYYEENEDTVINMTVVSPSGDVITSNSPEYREEREFKFIIIEINDTAEPGWWHFYFDELLGVLEVLVSVSSRQPPGGAGAITATAVMNSAVTNVEQGENMVIFSEVKQGSYPVLRCNVIATVERPDGDPIQLELFDNGAGADLTAGDGIYSRYFTEYDGEGFYGVQVTVHNADETAVLSTQGENGQYFSLAQPYVDPYQLLDGNISQTENDLMLLPGMPPPAFNETKAPQFMRRTSGGSNRVPSVPTGDFLPPCRIRDLQVSTSSYNDSLVMLSFTAPGGNLDFGKAHRYSIQSSLNLSRETAFDIQETDILEGNLTMPQEYGNNEQFVINVNLAPEEKSVAVMYFAITAYDENNNTSGYSNIGQATFRRYIPAYVPLPSSHAETTASIRITTRGYHVTTDSPGKIPVVTIKYNLEVILVSCLSAGIVLFLLIFFGVACFSNHLINLDVKDQNQQLGVSREDAHQDMVSIPTTSLDKISTVSSRSIMISFDGPNIISSEIHNASTLEEVTELDSDSSSSSWPEATACYPNSTYGQCNRQVLYVSPKYDPSFDANNIPGQYF
ncbi:putative calcium-activated chloride channel regulator 1-like [Apostichopus japonicus]|uniref:Putative calcium-activated chloride channel regulator 1-like n=1 Tax=Stichopus japonicus TaxID=307972 RepID=A0A2G8L7X4_STIJA|nr:putative calcium-activated chloride channel regulator 1-like [Apostichopus japonicus]